jgi:hypothetical protein
VCCVAVLSKKNEASVNFQKRDIDIENIEIHFSRSSERALVLWIMSSSTPMEEDEYNNQQEEEEEDEEEEEEEEHVSGWSRGWDHPDHDQHVS